jgi:hypothetical protein
MEIKMFNGIHTALDKKLGFTVNTTDLQKLDDAERRVQIWTRCKQTSVDKLTSSIPRVDYVMYAGPGKRRNSRADYKRRINMHSPEDLKDWAVLYSMLLEESKNVDLFHSESEPMALYSKTPNGVSFIHAMLGKMSGVFLTRTGLEAFKTMTDKSEMPYKRRDVKSREIYASRLLNGGQRLDIPASIEPFQEMSVFETEETQSVFIPSSLVDAGVRVGGKKNTASVLIENTFPWANHYNLGGLSDNHVLGDTDGIHVDSKGRPVRDAVDVINGKTGKLYK